jgi:hypothetical protein
MKLLEYVGAFAWEASVASSLLQWFDVFAGSGLLQADVKMQVFCCFCCFWFPGF